MTNKYKFWCIHEKIVPDVFKMYRRPSMNDLNRVKKWVSLSEWDIFGNVRQESTSVQGNIEIMEFLFRIIVDEHTSKDIEMIYCIEPNPINESIEEQYYHSHFLIRIDLTQKEIDLLTSKVYNIFPNHQFERYNESFNDSGKDYTTKHMNNDLERFDYLKHTKRNVR